MSKQINFKCGCGSEILNIEINDDFSADNPDIFLSMFKKYYGDSFIGRIKQIFKILKTGNPYEDEMILNLDDLVKLKEFIESLDITMKT